MTERTKKAIELTKEIFGDAKIIFEEEWNRKIRKPDFNPTLRTIAKYIGYKHIIEYQTIVDDGDPDCIEEYTVEFEYYKKI